MKIAWVTGGGTGIGRALAEALYRQGAYVLITGRRKEVLEKTAQEIRALPSKGQLVSMVGDAGDPVHISEVMNGLLGHWGAVDLLINNAGTNDSQGAERATLADYQKSFEINCLAAIRTTQAVLPAMRERGQGTIVNISSVYGRWASARSATYSVGKYAQAGFTDALRQSLVGTSIHVLGVYPGFIKTDMTMPFVQPGSLKSYIGKSPAQMANAILKAVASKSPELYYPWYVPWLLRLHRWFPVFSDRLAQRVKR